MELTINELDDYHNKHVSWLEPEIEIDGTNDRTFSAQQYNPDDLHPPSNRGSLNRRQTQVNQLQPQQPAKREPLNYDDILLKLNVQIVNGVMRYADKSKGFTFENAAKTNAPNQVKSQVKPQVKPQAKPQVKPVNVKPLTAEEHKECRIKQEMDRRRLNQVKSTKMLIPNNNNATISRPVANNEKAIAPSVKCPVINGTGMFKMKMGK